MGVERLEVHVLPGQEFEKKNTEVRLCLRCFVHTHLNGTLIANMVPVTRENSIQCISFYKITGVGYGMVQVPTVAPLLMYFTDQFGLANGISAAGGAVGMIILPPLTEKLITMYSWRGASVILGVANLHTTVAGALMRPPTTYKDKRLYFNLNGDTDSLLHNNSKSIFAPVKRFASSLKENLSIEVFRKQPRFIVYQVIFLLSAIQFAGWHLFLVPNALSRGVSPYNAAFLASIGGVGNIIGRAGNGPLLDHNICSDTTLFMVIHLILAVVLLFDPLAKTYAAMGFLAFFAGATVGGGYAVTVYIAKDLASSAEHGEGSVMAAVGWTHFFMGFGALLGGPLVGKIRHGTGELTTNDVNKWGCATTNMGSLLIYQLLHFSKPILINRSSIEAQSILGIYQLYFV